MSSLIVDPRAGSRDLVPHLRALGVRVELEHMTYGDVAFVGNGPDGPIPIGIEHKSVADVLACITSGRFTGHQLPGLLESFAHTWLVVEGAFRAGKNGALLVRHKGKFAPVSWGQKEWLYRHLSHWLLSVEVQGGCRVVVTLDKPDSAAFIKSLFTWWTAKKWDEHETLHTLDNTLQRTIGYSRPSYRRRFAACLPGVGWQRSADAARHFPTIESMVAARAEEWSKVPGIGDVTARKIRNAIVGRG